LGPAAGYSGLPNPDCPEFFSSLTKPNAHMRRQSLGREPGRAAVVGAIYERSERIDFSVRLLAIRNGACAIPERSLQEQNGDKKAAAQDAPE
jgi:hypothetical protein